MEVLAWVKLFQNEKQNVTVDESYDHPETSKIDSHM
jgi:hypothetical protein